MSDEVWYAVIDERGRVRTVLRDEQHARNYLTEGWRVSQVKLVEVQPVTQS